jgi:Protein of unknown function (DUF2514)
MGLISPLLGIVRAIPLWVWALAAALAWGGWQKHRATSIAAEFAQAQQQAAAEREQALAATIAETARRLAAQQEATRRADTSLAKARGAAASAAVAADGLRSRLAAIKADAAASNPAATGAGQTDRLAELLGTCADRHRDVAAAADRAIIAGIACEQSYNALTPP